MEASPPATTQQPTMVPTTPATSIQLAPNSFTTITTTTTTTTTTATTNNISLYTTSSSSNNHNMTNEDIRQYLDRLQDQEIKLYIPAMVFLVILAVAGLVGNVLVLLVYRSRRHKSPTVIFIMAIAMFDLVANIVCVPGEVYHMFHLWDVRPALCHLFRYVNASTTITSTFLLLAIAVTRYRKICRPFGRQVTTTKTKIITVCIFVFGWTAAIPNGIINGSRMKPIQGIVGHVCCIANSYIDTIFVLLIFLSTSIPLVVLYCLIGITVYQHRTSRCILMAINNTSSSAQCTQAQTSAPAEPENRTDKGKHKKVRIADSNSMAQTSDSKASSENESRSRQRQEEESVRETGEDNSVTMVRSPGNNQDSNVNFSMVRELTVKLKRIKSIEGNPSGEENEGCGVALLSEKEDEEDHTIPQDNCNDEKEDRKNDSKRTSPQSTEETDTAGAENSEPQVGFASRLQWIDMMYSLTEDNEEPPKTNKEAESKKSSRRVSRESSLLQKQKNFREQLMDTLSRRRGIKKDDIQITPKKDEFEIKKDNNMDEEGMLDHPNTDKNNADNNNSTNNNNPSVINSTTRVLIIITVVHIISYIPHVLLVWFLFKHPDNFQAMGTPSLIAHHLFLRFYFLNSAVNPIIYSLCDVNFRRDAFRVSVCCASTS